MTLPEEVRTLGPHLLPVKHAVELLHGADYTETDLNRLYLAIRRGVIACTEIGRRKFIPVWQVEKLIQRRLERENGV